MCYSLHNAVAEKKPLWKLALKLLPWPLNAISEVATEIAS